MGTRHLIAVVKDGAFKVAQYGQWDGYPEGQGIGVVTFLRKLLADNSMDLFKKQVDRCRWVKDEEVDKINETYRKEMEVIDRLPWDKRRAAARDLYKTNGSSTHLSRDVGSDILTAVLLRTDEGGLPLQNSAGFAGDSLFCEFAYVVDLGAVALAGYIAAKTW